MAVSRDPVIAFGPFRILLDRRVLLRDGAQVQLSARALQILIVLANRAGTVVETRKIMELVWPQQAVAEGTARAQIAALTRALNAHEPCVQYIQNVMGQGYRFVGSVARESGQSGPPTQQEPLPRTANPVATAIQLIGREREISELAAGLARPGLTTLLGPPGVGKTAVAAAVVDHWCRTHSKEARFLELGSIQDPEFARRAITAASAGSGARVDSATSLPHRFVETQTLLVLDGCEGVTVAVRDSVEQILGERADLCIVATSCEPIGVRQEHVSRLATLELPPLSVQTSAGLLYPAVRLFVQRAMGTRAIHELDETDITLVMEICRRLDGLPFALELAAAQVEVFGIAGVAAWLRDGLEILVGGRRTARPHQTSLRARLDWSDSLLSCVERAALGHLSCFVDSFDLAEASEALQGQARGPSEVAALLARLAASSLLETSGSGNHVFYRLLNTTRMHAREKLSRLTPEAAAQAQLMSMRPACRSKTSAASSYK